MCVREWGMEIIGPHANGPEIISWGIPEYLIKHYLVILLISPSLSLSNHLFSSKTVEQSWLSLLDLCSMLPSQKVCCTTANVIKWRPMALLSIFEISGLIRERMFPSVIQKSFQIVLSHPGPTRNYEHVWHKATWASRRNAEISLWTQKSTFHIYRHFWIKTLTF